MDSGNRDVAFRPSIDVLWRTDGDSAPPGCVAIVVDVLRASTNIITAFSLGAARCRVTRDVDKARLLARDCAALLVGERENKKIQGFDFGNSPLELTSSAERVRGSTIIFTSTNFPHALATAKAASVVLIGALVNLAAVCRRASEKAIEQGATIALILAGEPTEAHAFEDIYFAGRAAALLADTCDLTAAAQGAADQAAQVSPQQAMVRSVHAQELVRVGFAGDMSFASDADRFDVVPQLLGGWIIVP